MDFILEWAPINENATPPKRATPESAGLDIYTDNNYTILPGKICSVSTGIVIKIPHNCYGQLIERSGLALRCGISVLAGVIDRDYTGEIIVVLINLSEDVFHLDRGDAVAQLICHQISIVPPQLNTALLKRKTIRGKRSFSSGVDNKTPPRKNIKSASCPAFQHNMIKKKKGNNTKKSACTKGLQPEALDYSIKPPPDKQSVAQNNQVLDQLSTQQLLPENELTKENQTSRGDYEQCCFDFFKKNGKGLLGSLSLIQSDRFRDIYRDLTHFLEHDFDNISNADLMSIVKRYYTAMEDLQNGLIFDEEKITDSTPLDIIADDVTKLIQELENGTITLLE